MSKKEPETKIVKAEEVTAEIVESINPSQMKAIEQAVAKVMISLDKKDYSAKITHKLEQGQVPDAMTAFIDVDEGKQNEFGYNRDLDVKGTITPYEHYINQLTRFLTVLTELEDWEYITIINENGEKEQIEVDLPKLYAEEGRFLSMSRNGTQSDKEIKLAKAFMGVPDIFTEDKNAKWFGVLRKKKSDVYPQNQEG